MKVYGRECVEVEHPGGDREPYPVTPVPVRPGEWVATTVTNRGNEVYRVARDVRGRWHCTCKDWAFRFRPNRKRSNGAFCKHIEAVANYVNELALSHSRAAGEGTPDSGAHGVLPDAGRSNLVNPPKRSP